MRKIILTVLIAIFSYVTLGAFVYGTFCLSFFSRVAPASQCFSDADSWRGMLLKWPFFVTFTPSGRFLLMIIAIVLLLGSIVVLKVSKGKTTVRGVKP